MTPIADVASRIRANPAPVLIVDTCNFLDLFRVARPTKDTAERRVELDELLAAVELLTLLGSPEPALYHVVPELVPGEFLDNAGVRVQEPFERWVEAHDKTQPWLAEAGKLIGVALPNRAEIRSADLPSRLRSLAEELLATATVLARDRTCLDRAVARLIEKRRPSHKKEIKDSMNLEQALELCRQLSANEPFPHPMAFVSSNTSDFALPKNNREEDIHRDVHSDLNAEFHAVSLLYFTSLRAAREHLADGGYGV